MEKIIISTENKIREIITESVTAAFNNYEKPERFISRKEACRRMGITLPTLDKAIRRGDIEAVRIGGRVLIKEN
ncbi:MAG: excisionase family DNA-binding protein [Bacteroidales bacterium]|jgi:excisionase family DNA binding protein|nr:excisionase family DNA-binding protein [Bacteroidales bacterium]